MIKSYENYGHREEMEVSLLQHSYIAFRGTKDLFIAPVIFNDRIIVKTDFEIEKQVSQPKKKKEDKGKGYN
jgi:hypothetical protein